MLRNFTFLVCFFWSVAGGAQAPSAWDLLLEAKKYPEKSEMNEKKNQEALDLFLAAESKSHNILNFVGIGRAYFGKNQPIQALSFYFAYINELPPTDRTSGDLGFAPGKVLYDDFLLAFDKAKDPLNEYPCTQASDWSILYEAARWLDKSEEAARFAKIVGDCANKAGDKTKAALYWDRYLTLAPGALDQKEVESQLQASRALQVTPPKVEEKGLSPAARWAIVSAPLVASAAMFVVGLSRIPEPDSESKEANLRRLRKDDPFIIASELLAIGTIAVSFQLRPLKHTK